MLFFFRFYHVLSFVSLIARQRNKRKVPKKKKKTRFLLLVSSMLIDSTKALMSFWIYFYLAERQAKQLARLRDSA